MRLSILTNMLKFAFLLGIVFISFNFIWFLFTSLLKIVLGETGNIERYILRISQSYFLASVSALATINYSKMYDSQMVLISTGVVVLFLYLINKIEQRKKLMQFNLQMNKDLVTFNSSNLKYDILIAISTVILYVFSVNNPAIPENGINNWLFQAINSLYNAFFIGWIIGIMGVFFIISIFFKGLISFQLIYAQFSEMINGEKKPAFDETEGFTEYEIVEEDDVKEKEEVLQIEDKE